MWGKIKPEELHENPFSLIGEDWMLVAASDGSRVNAMTASWGGMGILWNKKVAFVFIRPQRYTKELIDQSGKLSLSFFDEGSRKMLNYMGTVSGRDEDKIAACGLHVEMVNSAPVFQESRMAIICRKLYAQPMEEACFLTRFASEVTVVHRRDRLRASKIMAERAEKNPKIKFVWNAVVSEIYGGSDVDGIKVRDVQTGEEKEIPCKGVFVALGHVPNTQAFAGQLAMDESGYIELQSNTSYTSVEGVFGAGDCADKRYRQAITAAGMGARAAIDAERWLEN